MIQLRILLGFYVLFERIVFGSNKTRKDYSLRHSYKYTEFHSHTHTFKKNYSHTYIGSYINIFHVFYRFCLKLFIVSIYYYRGAGLEGEGRGVGV